MEIIFDKFIAQEITGDTKIKKAYSSQYNHPMSWIECEDISIQQLVDRICESLEQEGHDLEETPIEKVKEIFCTFKLEIKVPAAYTSLYEAKQQLMNVYKLYETWDVSAEDKANFLKHLQSFDTEMEKLKHGES